MLYSAVFENIFGEPRKEQTVKMQIDSSDFQNGELLGSDDYSGKSQFARLKPSVQVIVQSIVVAGGSVWLEGIRGDNHKIHIHIPDPQPSGAPGPNSTFKEVLADVRARSEIPTAPESPATAPWLTRSTLGHGTAFAGDDG